jgi:hypothetical protein
VPIIRRNNCIYATFGICHYVWMMSGMLGGIHSTLHTRQSSTQSDKYQVSHRYSYFSWWWARSRPKHVEKRNKHTKKNCAPSWLYLQDSCNSRVHKRPSLQITMAHEQPICLTSKNVGNMHNMRVWITWKTVWQWRSFLFDSTNCLAHEPCVCMTSKRTTHENLRPWLLKP